MRYIDADKTKNDIDNCCSLGGIMGEAVNKVYEWAKDFIDSQPTADVRENITAHKVIGGGEHKGATCWFECSQCGKTVDANDKYCSECGARFVQRIS